MLSHSHIDHIGIARFERNVSDGGHRLVVEEGLWRIDTIYWANGKIVRGFEPDEKSTDAKKSESGEAQ